MIILFSMMEINDNILKTKSYVSVCYPYLEAGGAPKGVLIAFTCAIFSFRT